MLQQKFIKSIIKILKDEVKFAYIFGSVLTKYFKKDSDIDLAVWLNQYPMLPEAFIDLKYRLEESIKFTHDIDLVNAGLIITNEAITKGKLIIDNKPEFTENFYLSRRSMYMDFKIFRKNLEENLKEQIL